MRRVGVVGGTFDPVHFGHLLLAQFVSEHLELDEVLFIPAADPPHKQVSRDRASAEERWCMVKLALTGWPCFRASRLELDRPGKSYTVNTLQQLRHAQPDSDFFLIVGADNAALLSTWRDPEDILSLCTVVAGSRVTNGDEIDCDLAPRIMSVDTPMIEISSSDIRARVAHGRPVRCMVPESVRAFIYREGLYSQT